jgi:peptidoglycan/LPS O-acetylase OafA/YrhL
MREVCASRPGTWRFFLAFVVALSHLWAGMIDGPAAYAVWGFFVLSGYLMTLVLSTKYGIAPAGLRQFATNRLLRIYPSFIAAGALGIATILALRPIGIDPAGLNPQFLLPRNVSEWFSNLAMVPFVTQQGLPVPVAAALFVEVWAYALMPLFAGSRGAACLGLALAVCANLQFGFGMATFVLRYCGFATGLMPFAAGAVVYHYRDALRRFASPVLSLLCWCVHGLYWLHDAYWPWTYGLWLSVPLSAWVVLSLAEMKSHPSDKIAGDLSYGRGLVSPLVRLRARFQLLRRIVRRDPPGRLAHVAPGGPADAAPARNWAPVSSEARRDQSGTLRNPHWTAHGSISDNVMM